MINELFDYVQAGASLDEVLKMQQILQQYKEEVHIRIAKWHELVPEDGSWNKPSKTIWLRCKTLRAIVTWFLQQGYIIEPPVLLDDNVIWKIVKNRKVILAKNSLDIVIDKAILSQDEGQLRWKNNYFFVEGLPCPDKLPEHISRWSYTHD